MLAPRASSAFVCLRCELTLARPSISALARRPPRASFSSSSRRRDALDDALKPQPRLSAHPLGRVRRRKGGHTLRETTAHLEGTKTLGKDASIIVLEELGEGKREETQPAPAPAIVTADDEIPLKLAEALADEQPATLDEVVEQLDKLKEKATADDPNGDQGYYVNQTVYTRLSNHLLGAFNSTQLSYYYSKRKGVKKNRVVDEVRGELKELQAQTKRPSVRSKWTPGVTQIDRRLPSLDIHSKNSRLLPKHLLVDQILRNVWKLVMLEEIETSGEIDLVLKDWQLPLLTSGVPETALDRIGRERMAKLEVNKEDMVLRITADKHTAEYAADDVQRILQESETRRFKFTRWLPYLEASDNGEPFINNVFPEDILATVTSLTGAQLQRATDTIIIRALDKQTAAEAERCLIRLLPLKSLVPSTLDTTGRATLDSSEHFLPVVFEKESVDFKVRSLKMGRWSTAIGKDGAAIPTSDDVSERVKTAQEHVIKMMNKPFSQHEHSDTKALPLKFRTWSYQPEVRLKAQYGRLSFPLEEPTSTKPHFVSGLPGLTSVFNHESFDMTYITKPTLRYEFIAQPGSRNDSSGISPYKFPTLSFYFRPNNEGQHGLAKAVLSFGTAKHRVLLPEQSVDIQFETTKSLLMHDAKTNQATRVLREEIRRNMQYGARLTAPDVDINIPKWIIEGMESDGKEDLVETRYQFVGIKMNQNLWGEFDGHPATYSTMQSGKLGAKSSIFSTVYGVNKLSKKIAYDDPPNAMRAFVANAFATAGKITKAAAAAVVASPERLEKPARQPRQQQSPGSRF